MPKKLKFGETMGGYGHTQKVTVPAYSSHYRSADPETYRHRRDYQSWSEDEIYCGSRFQCVEYSRRYLVQHDHTFDDVHMAYEIFDLPHFYHIYDRKNKKMERVSTIRCHNGKQCEDDVQFNKPLPGSLMIWYPVGWFKHTGHVAVVTEVVRYGNNSNKYGVRIAEQNTFDSDWEGRNFSRELPAFVDEKTGAFNVLETTSGSKVMGWICAPSFYDVHPHPTSHNVAASASAAATSSNNNSNNNSSSSSKAMQQAAAAVDQHEQKKCCSSC